MIYRKNDALGTNTSLLGFGCMRLPIDANGDIDYEAAIPLIDKAYESGVNYFDTAFGYIKEQSEDFVGKAICQRYPRESFYLADKLPVWKTNNVEEAEEVFQVQMGRLRTDYVDFHLLHALGKERWDLLKTSGILEWQRKKKQEGVFKHIGFSFHDKPEVLKEILEYQEWDFCQIQLNYLDWDLYESKAMYDLCREYNVPMIIMEPIRGGSLANPHEDVQKLFRAVAPSFSPAAIALRFVADLEGIVTILSGMSTMEQVEENLVTLGNFQGVSKEEEQMYVEAREIFAKLPLIPCTSCKYCEICPSQIEMWQLFNKYNHYISYNDKWPLVNYVKEHPEDNLPPSCIQCYACESQCPQHISIVEKIQEVYAVAKDLGA